MVSQSTDSIELSSLQSGAPTGSLIKVAWQLVEVKNILFNGTGYRLEKGFFFYIGTIFMKHVYKNVKMNSMNVLFMRIFLLTDYFILFSKRAIFERL